jgi:hypothetical protein
VKVLWFALILWGFILPLEHADRIFDFIIEEFLVSEPRSRIDRMPVVVGHLITPPIKTGFAVVREKASGRILLLADRAVLLVSLLWRNRVRATRTMCRIVIHP